MKISFRKLENINKDYKLLYDWCKNRYVYEWFEQRVLSFEEIRNKYLNKLKNRDQDLFIIQCDGKDIGLVQIYRFEHDIKLKELDSYNNIYEFDIFIGEEEYLSKGIGSTIVNKINNIIFSNYDADVIILRPFKRNIRAIKCYLKCDYKIIDEYLGKDTLGNPEKIVVLINKKH